VLEELAAGDVDIAAVLGHTAVLGHLLFDRVMNAEQRARFLQRFAQDDACHLAFAGEGSDALAGWCYHRPLAAEAAALTVQRENDGDWVLNGSLDFVANAPLAALFVVEAVSDNGCTALLVPRDAPGLTVHEPVAAIGAGGQRIRWHHGTAAAVSFSDCRVPASSLLGVANRSPFADGVLSGRAAPLLAAINLGVGRAAFEAAVDYAKLRRQGGCNIVEHQAIGAKLAGMATRMETARNLVWKAAWVCDHPEAVQDRSIAELPLAVMARCFTAEAVHEVTLEAAECFGAMGVMRDMPLQKYVHDALVFLHAMDNDGAATLRIAEAVAGYRRPLAA
jgi:alkylation response protein AidB-like acyl-CoA dehydrogenase